jgi:phosphate transport system permease protein
MDRKELDSVVTKFTCILAVLTGVITIVIALILVWKSIPIFHITPIPELLFSSIWQPAEGRFGFYPFIIGTIWVTLLSMTIAIPLAVLSAIYLAEYAPTRIRTTIKPIMDLLAGIPSILFGLWGVIVIVPLVRNDIAPLFGISTTGDCVLTGGIVLSIMVLPIIISISDELFRTVPLTTRIASLAMGATKWQTVKYVLIRKVYPGLLAAIILGFSRAFGETMAVLMVVGNVAKIPSSVFDPAYPLPALIANNYGEMLSVPLFDSALMFAALILFCIVVLFNICAKMLLMRFKERGVRHE